MQLIYSDDSICRIECLQKTYIVKSFKFNQIYVIQSLPVEYDDLGNEKKQTGEQLYDDLLKWQVYKHCLLTVHFEKISNRQEWDALMKAILQDCLDNGNIPLLHFEIHGAATKDVFTPGFVLADGTLVGIEDIGQQLRAINVATGFNLFITLAVCKGMSLLLNMHLNEAMPFIGAIGSFYELSEQDLLIRYMDFYTELFDSFDVAKAYIALSNANPSMPVEYRYIPADELFIRNYQQYIDEQCSPEAIKKRARDSEHLVSSQINNRADRRRFHKDFAKHEKLHRNYNYKAAIDHFFQLKTYPENVARFGIPTTIAELKEMSKRLLLV